jgi:hypothetical protein
MLTFLSLLLFVAAAPNAVHADDEIPPRWRRHIVIAGTLLGPTGAIGAELEYSPIPQLGVNVGAGVGSLIPNDGPEFGFMVRPRYVLPGAGFALGVGAGLSLGRYTDREGRSQEFLGLRRPCVASRMGHSSVRKLRSCDRVSLHCRHFRVGGGFPNVCRQSPCAKYIEAMAVPRDRSFSPTCRLRSVPPFVERLRSRLRACGHRRSIDALPVEATREMRNVPIFEMRNVPIFQIILMRERLSTRSRRRPPMRT